MQVAEHTETAKVTTIPMGSTIPDWLLAADPLVAGAPKGAWRFDCDVVVIELASDIFVWPIIPLGVVNANTVLDWTGMDQHNVYATGKTVRVIHQFNSIFPIEYGPAVAEHRRQLAAQASVTTAAPGTNQGGPLTEARRELASAEQVDRRLPFWRDRFWLSVVTGLSGGVAAGLLGAYLL